MPMKNKIVWHSGDWKKSPRINEPYNGIEIIGIPLYDEDNKFTGAKLEIRDYTYEKSGVSACIKLMTTADEWVDIPGVVPSSPPIDPSLLSVKGQVKLRPSGCGILLRVNFSYGLKSLRHEELGFVMKFMTMRESDASGTTV